MRRLLSGVRLAGIVVAMIVSASPLHAWAQGVVDDLVASSSGAFVTLTWTLPNDPLGFGDPWRAEDFDIRYSGAGEITNQNWDASPIATSYGGPVAYPNDSVSVTFPMSPDGTYWYGVSVLWVSDDVGVYWTFASNSPSDTVDSVAPGPISPVLVEAVQPGGATLSWAAPGDDASVGTAATYVIRYSTLPMSEPGFDLEPEVFGPVPNPAPAETPEQVTVGLPSSGGIFYIGMKAIDDKGNAGPLSDVVMVAVPAVPNGGAGEGGGSCGGSSPGAVHLPLLVWAAAAFLRPSTWQKVRKL